MKKILFIRRFKYPTGGHITVRDYFMHSLEHPQLSPYMYFTPESDYHESDIWQPIPRERILPQLGFEGFDLIFLGGKDWRYVPEHGVGGKIINIVQHVKHAKKDELRSYLKREAFRICISREVQEAIQPFIQGVSVVIPNAVDFKIFRDNGQKRPNSILIWAQKNPALGQKLYSALAARNLEVEVLVDALPREAFAARLQQADIFVALPNRTEGFYRPSIEGMASRCAVICSDAKGNRSHCIAGETCLQPVYNHFEQHLQSVMQLIESPDLKEKIRAKGYETAQSFSMDMQKKKYYQFLETFIL